MVNHEEINNISGFSPEVQAGIGYTLNEHVTLNLGYQVVWGKAPEISINSINNTGLLRYLPRQQAVMFGVSFNLL